MPSNQLSRREFIRNGLIAGEAAALALWMNHNALAAQELLISKRTDGTPYKQICQSAMISARERTVVNVKELG